MSDFFHRLFLQPPGTGPDFFTDFCLSTMGILVLSGIAIYIISVILLLSSLHRSKSAHKNLDMDVRAKMCLGWAALATFVLLGAGVFWIRWKALMPEQPNVWAELGSFACHLTSMFVIGVLWVVFYWRMERDVRHAGQALR